MTRKKQKRGENDVNAIVLKGYRVQCADHIEILHTDYKIPEYRCAFGYYELDNKQKNSIYHNPYDGCIYVKSPHFGWENFDRDDVIDLPCQRVKMARDNIGCDIMLNASESRDATEAAACFDKVDSENIPRQFQQKTYQKQNGCVWLSACLLIYLVDRDIDNNMVKCYKEDKERYEQLEFFIKKNKV